MLTGDFISHLNGTSSLGLIRATLDHSSTDDSLNRILELEWKTQLPDQVLAFVDFLSMAHSVEVRSPFLDFRLVEFAATLPGTLKIRGGNVKDILKKTVRRLLPQEIVERPKEGFVLPLFDWMTERLKGYIFDVLAADRLRKHDLLNIHSVEELLSRYYGGDRGCAGKIWNLVMFQLWWEKYFG